MVVRTVRRCSLALLLLAIPAAAAHARIKLITLPARERVEVQLDHARATLVEEERIVPLRAGINQVDFSWTNTYVDPHSILFRVLDDDPSSTDGVRVLAVSYPPNEQALVWSVHAPEAGSARVRISYLLGRLEKQFSYRAVATHDERLLTLSQLVRVKNFSNEAFAQTGLWVGYGDRLLKPLARDETREMLVRRYRDVPVIKTYTADLRQFGYLDPAEHKLRVAMHYVLENDREHGLGEAALPGGKVRIFQRDGHGGTAFLGEDWGKFTAPDDEMRLFLGVARDVVVRRHVEHQERRRVDGNLFDQEVVLRYEIENFKPEPVRLDVVENVRELRAALWGDRAPDPQWKLGRRTSFSGGVDPEHSGAEQLVVHAPLPGADSSGGARRIVHRLHLIVQNEWR